MSCIAIIGGLIGCGKTTLINHLQKNGLNFEFNKRLGSDRTFDDDVIYFRISLDELCPIEDQAKMMDSLKGWKCFRHDLLMAAEHFICSVIDSKFVMYGPLTERSCHLMEKLKEINDWDDCGRRGHFVFLSEDNFYYRSMRYDWFQISKRASIGFCEVFVKCPLDTAISRNHNRGYRIPEDRIKFMSHFIEYPEPKKYKWEKFSTLFNSSDILDAEALKPVFGIMEEAAKRPAEMLLMADKIDAQSVCSKNVVHQADIILRKLVSETVSSKRSSCTDSDMSSFTSLVIRVRQRLLSLMKQGEVEFPKRVLENLKLHGVESVQKELEEALREHFEEAINQRTLFESPSEEEESRILLSLKAFS